MIDPDGILVETQNKDSLITVNQNIPDFDFLIYNLEDEKDYKKFISDIEKEVRKSFEYRAFIKYLRENMDMSKCSFLKGVSNEESFDIKIEIHHYPFTLYDISEIVLRKRTYFQESLNLQMIAKEVMQLHYKLMIGLISLSETVHELVHSAKLFIPVENILGRYNVFVDYYKPFCTEEQLDALSRIEKYSEEKTTSLLDTTILNQNRVNYNIKDSKYKLPDFSSMKGRMFDQIAAIKKNDYAIPNPRECNLIEDKGIEITCPIYFGEYNPEDQMYKKETIKFDESEKII